MSGVTATKLVVCKFYLIVLVVGLPRLIALLHYLHSSCFLTVAVVGNNVGEGTSVLLTDRQRPTGGYVMHTLVGV